MNYLFLLLAISIFFNTLSLYMLGKKIRELTARFEARSWEERLNYHSFAEFLNAKKD